MRVLHVIPSVSPALGGPTQVVLNLVKALRDVQVDAEIATTNDCGLSLLDVPLHERIDYQGVPVWFLPRFSPPLKEFIFSWSLTTWLWQHLAAYDLVDTHYLFSYAPTCAATIAHYQHIPYTVRTMGQLAPWALAQSRLKKQLYATLVERRNLNRAAVVHCTSDGEAMDVQRFGVTAPLVTVPLGVDPQADIPDAAVQLRQRYEIAADTPIVLFLSRLHYKKRPDLLLQALHQLRDRYRFHCLLAGSGDADYTDYVARQIADLGLMQCTTMTGFMDGYDKRLLLQGADLFVLPSFSENFGIAVAEALAAGLPVVITPGVQIAPEVDRAKAGLVVEGTVEAVAGAIAQLLTSVTLRQQLGTNGKQLAANRYSWYAVALEQRTIYQGILEQSSKPQRLR